MYTCIRSQGLAPSMKRWWYVPTVNIVSFLFFPSSAHFFGPRYNPEDFKNMKVSSEIEELFNCITRCWLIFLGMEDLHGWHLVNAQINCGWNLDINDDNYALVEQQKKVSKVAKYKKDQKGQLGVCSCGPPNFSHDQILFRRHPYMKSRSITQSKSLGSSLNSAGSELICKLIPSGKPGGFLGFNSLFLIFSLQF